MDGRQYGYSLAEALVVLAIIGMISLVSVPAFISMSHQNRLKASTFQFANDLRAARQRAVTTNNRVRVSFATGPDARSYSIYDFTGTDIAPAWTKIPLNADRTLDLTCHFESTTFTDQDDPVDGLDDIIFRPSGSLVPSGSYDVLVKSTFTDISKPIFTATLGPTGNLTVH